MPVSHITSSAVRKRYQSAEEPASAAHRERWSCWPPLGQDSRHPRRYDQRRRLAAATLTATLLASLTLAGCHHDSTDSAVPQPNNSKGGANVKVANPVPQRAPAPRVIVQGLYATGWSAGLPKKLDNLIATIHRSGLNSIVIDVKDSDGAVSYYTPNVPLAVEIGACSKKPSNNRCRDIDTVLKKLKAANIHTIGRVVCFNDPVLAKKRTDLAIKTAGGGIWRNRHGPWVDPTRKEVWQYNIDLAVDAIKRGFDEIQWDYVRFPSEGDLKSCVYSEPTGKDRAYLFISDYLSTAYAALKQYGVPVSADIFGLTGTAKSDMGIGQKIKAIADHVDYISPMVYPSHFAHGEYHLPNPNAAPYQTIVHSLGDAKKRLVGFRTGIRPWLQAFTLGSPPYGPSQIIEQLKGENDNHLSEFLFWNASNKYDIVEEALTTTEGRRLLAQMISDAPPEGHSGQQASASPSAPGGSASQQPAAS